MIDRRKFMQISAMGTLGLLTDGTGGLLKNSLVSANSAKNSFNPDLEILLRATQGEVPIMPGAPTGVWLYKGKVLKGSEKSLQNSDMSYLGPTIRVRKGQKVRIHFKNEIPDESIVHWHGLHVPANMDGHPRFVIPQGKNIYV